MNSSIPSPLVVEITVEPRSSADVKQLTAALQKMTAEDEDFEAVVDADSGHAIFRSPDEYQLDTKIDLLRQTYGIDLFVGQPPVSYRETITHGIEVEYTHRRSTGGVREFAKAKIAVEPNARGQGNIVETNIDSETVPETYLPGIRRGIEAALKAGPVAGFPVTDVTVRLESGAYHDTDSSVLAFEIAARAACREALRGAEPRLLEPFMSVEVHAPEEYAGSIKGDLESRRGVVERIDRRDGMVIIAAEIPMTNMFGYGNQLRAFSQGFGTFSMRYKDYRVLDSLNNPTNPPPAAAAAMRA